jgi:hypothetical protein
MNQKEKRYNILDELAKLSGYDIALMTTFNFEISFFERAILNRLYANDVRSISLYIDSKEFTKALREVNDSHIGRKYMVNSVNITSSFHPKVILLLGENKAKLFVGSGNIKTSGYVINNEIFNHIEYSPEKPECLDVIYAAINFFVNINDITYQLDNSILHEARELVYYHNARENGEIYLLHNMHQSILKQVQDRIDETLESISIAVPYYDNELLALSSLKKVYGEADIHLYIQNEKSTFPVKFNNNNNIVTNIDLFEGFKDNLSGSSNNFYHGKVFLFKTAKKSYILYGSVNCTQAALIKSFYEGGNIECDFFEIGEVKEFDYFFENMKLQSEKKLVSNKMIFEKQDSINHFFKYGEEKDGFELHIGYVSLEKDLKVFLGEQIMEYIIKDHEILVFIPDEYRHSISDIFNITLHYKGKQEILRCWTFNEVALKNNRIKQSDKNLLGDFDINSDGDKYIEDRYNLLKAELTCLPELKEHKKKLACYNQIKQEQEGDDVESEEFIVDVEIPDEYRVAYKQYNTVAQIRNVFMRRFFQSQPGTFIAKKVVDTKENKNEKIVNKKFSVKPRKATSEEKKFERFVKSNVKTMLNDEYVKIIEPEHYIGIIMVVLDIFNKYNNIDKVEDVFETSYVLKTRTNFFLKLLGKEIKSDNKEKTENSILMRCYSIFFDNYVLQVNEPDFDIRRNYNSINRMLLMEMEKKYGIRSVYEEHLRILEEGNKSLAEIGIKNISAYIENLFGYKNLDLLEKYIDSIYDNVSIEIRGKVIIITATSTDIHKHLKPDLSVLREINNYASNVLPIDLVKFIIESRSPNQSNQNAIVKIKYSVSLASRHGNSTTIWKNGKMFNEKLRYLNF